MVDRILYQEDAIKRLAELRDVQWMSCDSLEQASLLAMILCGLPSRDGSHAASSGESK